MSTTAENLERIRIRIVAAAARSQRDANKVRLLGATKTVPPERIREAVAAGQQLFGENRVQEAAAKIEQLGGRLHWHFIGHLQKNKVRSAVSLFEMIESVDSLMLAQEIDRQADRVGKTMPILLEVNIAGEKTKFGFQPDELFPQLAEINALTHISIYGLMTVPPFSEDPQNSRPYFRALGELKRRIEREWRIPLEELSMGMSQDFEIAVEEGATIVRVGEALWGSRRAREEALEEEL